MTDEQLREIEERANSATPGPWLGPWAMTEGRFLAGRRVEGTGDDWHVRIEVEGSHRACAHADSNFIAHAREDIPALIAEIRRLKGQNAPPIISGYQHRTSGPTEGPIPFPKQPLTPG